jgi:hypothetical protein
MTTPTQRFPPYSLTFAVIEYDIGTVQRKIDAPINEIITNPLPTDYLDFKQLFYQADSFGIQTNVMSDPALVQKISFDSLVTSVDNGNLYLLEEVYQNIEESASISRGILSDATVFQLNQTISAIKTIPDVISGSTTENNNSLNWTTLQTVVKNYYVDQSLKYNEPTPTSGKANLSISVMFVSKSLIGTVPIKPINIKFNYDVVIPF